MEKKDVIETLKKVRESSKERKFAQRVDLILNLKDLDIKKPENQVDFFLNLPKGKGVKTSVCALVGPELWEDAKKDMDHAILQDDFAKYATDKKAAKQVAEKYDVFIAQANIMAKAAGAFGRVLGVRGKMPNPKAGCVIPPKTNLKALHTTLQSQIRISAKTSPMIQVPIGTEKMSDEELTENFMAVYNALVHALPAEKNNIKNMFLKTTMGKPVSMTAN